MTVPIAFFAIYTPSLIQQGIEIEAGKGNKVGCTIVIVNPPCQINIFGYNYSYRNITYFVTSQPNYVFSQNVPSSLNFTIDDQWIKYEYTCYSQNYQNQYVAVWQRTYYDAGVVAYVVTATVLTVFFILFGIIICCYISRSRKKVGNLSLQPPIYSLDHVIVEV